MAPLQIFIQSHPIIIVNIFLRSKTLFVKHLINYQSPHKKRLHTTLRTAPSRFYGSRSVPEAKSNDSLDQNFKSPIYDNTRNIFAQHRSPQRIVGRVVTFTEYQKQGYLFLLHCLLHHSDNIIDSLLSGFPLPEVVYSE